MKYHFGCGSDILPGYINCDAHPWPGIDRVINLAEPEFTDDEFGNVDEVFSNAFFEHLYIKERAYHLDYVYNCLSNKGIICYMGLPWFPGIAKAYMMKQPSTLNNGKPFDLYNAWRYTHGAPEEAGYSYLGQLHKGLFDKEELENLFRECSEPEWPVIFTYAYPGEPEHVHVTVGFIISVNPWDRIEAIQDATDYLMQWDGKYLNHASLDFRPTP